MIWKILGYILFLIGLLLIVKSQIVWGVSCGILGKYLIDIDKDKK